MRVPRREASRKRLDRIILALALAPGLVLALGAGCGTSRLIDVWRDPRFPGPAMTNLLVIAVHRDPMQRRDWEDGFGLALRGERIVATASREIFPAEVPDTHQVIAIVLSREIDGVVVLWEEGLEGRLPAARDTTPPRLAPNSWVGDYHAHYVDAYQPDPTIADSLRRQRVELWSPRQGGWLVWSGIAESGRADAPQEVRQEVTQAVVSEWRRARLIP